MRIEAPTNVISRLREGWIKSTPDQRVYFSNLGILMAAQTADLFFTNMGLGIAGADAEGWPVTKFIYNEAGGPLGISLLKLAGLGLILRYSELIRLRNNEQIASKLVRPVNILYTGIAMFNAVSVYSFNRLN